LRTGDEVRIMGPFGKYVYRDNPQKKVHIVTGAGIGPNYSMLKEWVAQGAQQESMLLFGVRTADNIAYADQFKAWAEQYPFTWYACVSREEGDGKWIRSGRVGAVLPQVITDFTNTEFYICGQAEMVEQTKELLLAQGVEAADIHYEEFNAA
jgi:ferredoxin-NADP reductase